MSEVLDLECAWAQERIEPHVDGELEANDRPRLEAHLAGCRSCERSVADARAMLAELRALPEQVLSQQANDALMQAVAARDAASMARSIRSRPRWSVPRQAIATLAAAAAVAAAFVWAVQDPLDTPAYSAEEIARAEEQTRLALALIAGVNQEIGQKVRDEVLADCVSRVLEAPLGSGPCAPTTSHAEQS